MSVDKQQAIQYYETALALYAEGRLSESEVAYRKAIKVNKNFADAYNNLGSLLVAQGRTKEAIGSFKKALKILPDDPMALNNLGYAFQLQNNLQKSEACYREAIRHDPEYYDAYCNLADILRIQEKEEVIEVYRKIVEFKPLDVDILKDLGNSLRAYGRLDEAIVIYRRAIEIDPLNKSVLNNMGNVLRLQDNCDEAIEVYRRVIEIDPDYCYAHNNLGIALGQKGFFEEAIAAYQRAIEIEPEYAKAHRYLSEIRRHTEYDNEIRVMEDLYASKDISEEKKMHLAFGLGKAFEDMEEHNKAFDYILEANRLKRATYEYSLTKEGRYFKRITESFSRDFFSAHKKAGVTDETPVFILGMPRSGTSLVEQILASHSQVFGAGERSVLANLTKSISIDGKEIGYPKYLPRLGESVFEKWGSEYIDQLRSYSPDAKHITDKMPANFLRVGLIKAILPNAKVIHCMRDPMDNCLSIFKKMFVGSHKYAYDMDELGQYYNLYLDLMEHWRNVLPGFMYEISYEELIVDQDGQTRRLLEYCGLPWEDACLSFHNTKRSVATASKTQVRRPIYKDSIGSWKRYGDRLEPLRKAIHV